MKLLLVTDAWAPQTNGVVRTLSAVVGELEAMGHRVRVISANEFRNFACPTYPEIRLAAMIRGHMAEAIAAFGPDCIHISTEGPLGLAARRYCLNNGLAFTTAWHTKFPDYVNARFGIPHEVTYGVMQWFHKPARSVMVPTPSLKKDLEARGFKKVKIWSRGVDTDLFHPRDEAFYGGENPHWLYVGRVAVEKNLEAFLGLDLPGTKHVVGDGPQREDLARRYPDTIFHGRKSGEELARHYAGADVFVFPSKTDTFGLVVLEALASGVPVAAYPATGPMDILAGTGAGVLNGNLHTACRTALTLDRKACRELAEQYSWRASAEQFLNNMRPLGDPSHRSLRAKRRVRRVWTARIYQAVQQVQHQFH